MDATSRARFRVLSILTVALVGVAGCASADSGDDSAMPSEVGTSSVTAPQSPSEPAAPNLQIREAEFEESLQYIMDRYAVPDAAVMLTTSDGTWSVERGTADFEAQTSIVDGMSWPLRSVTKSVVVTVFLQLVDEGQLSLDDTIDTYIEGAPNGDEISLRQLAEMSSGVGDYTHSEAFIDVLTADPSYQFTLEELNDYGIAEGAQFAPGADRVYSNTSTNLLGVVIEQVTGQSIDEYVIEELKLTDTVYAVSDEDWAAPYAQGYQPSNGDVAPIFNNFSSMGASGAMVSTTEDMSVWAKALATGELISPELQR